MLRCDADCWTAITIADGSTETSLVDNQILGYPLGVGLFSGRHQYSGIRMMTDGPFWAIVAPSGIGVDGGDNVW